MSTPPTPATTSGPAGLLQVRVITLDEGLSTAITRVFPEAQRFGATDLRSSAPTDLLQNGVITETAFESLTRGRKYHHEFSGIGGVGLCVSVSRLLNEGDGAILILESDCVPSRSLPGAIRELLAQAEDRFDMAVFGPLAIEAHSAPGDMHPQLADLAGYFWGMHAVLYSARGRRAVRERLTAPYDMQMDGKVSRLSVYAQVLPTVCLPPLRVLIQVRGQALARQALHVSTIQTACLTCALGPGPHKTPVLKIAAGLFAGTFIAGVIAAMAVARLKGERQKSLCEPCRPCPP